MTRPEFLAAAAQLGLNPKNAMDHLGVRTLEGLNLREALEALRRQMLRGANESADEPEPPSVSARQMSADRAAPRSVSSASQTPAAQTHTSPSGAPAERPPAYFDEEEDDFTFTYDEESALAELGAGSPPSAREGSDDEDAYGSGPGGEAFAELDGDDDVPDFGPPAGRASGRTPRPPSATRSGQPSSRASSARAAASEGAEPATGTTGAVGETSGPETQAVALIKGLRAATAGGTVSQQQRAALRNIVVSELGEPETRLLVQGLWRMPPEKLGPDQYEELISWGKRDTFADEARLVLAALEAEREAERQRARGAPSSTSTSTSTSSSTSVRPRSTTSRSGGQPGTGGTGGER